MEPLTATPTKHVAKDGTVTYKVRFRHGLNKAGTGPRQQSETFHSKREADRFARLLYDLGPQGALDQLYEEEQTAAVPTLNEVAADHFRLLTKVTEGTRKNYGRLWGRTWGPLIGDIPAHRVTRDDVASAVNVLAKHYSFKSLENQRGLLASVLGRAIELGYQTKNHARGIGLPETGDGDSVEMQILTHDQFLDILDLVPQHYRPLLWFLYGTGARWGEAVALTVADVAWPNVRIRRALKWSPDNQRHVGVPKTRRGNRTVVMPKELQESMAEACAGKARTDLVFTAPRGGAVLHRTFWGRVWVPAASHLEPRPRIHDLRHTHASVLLAAGVPIHVVSARLGHSNIQTTVHTYGHLLPDAQMVAANAASLAFSQRPALPERISP